MFRFDLMRASGEVERPAYETVPAPGLRFALGASIIECNRFRSERHIHRSFSVPGYGKARLIFSPCGTFSASRIDTPCNSAIAATSDSPRPLPGLPRLVSSR